MTRTPPCLDDIWDIPLHQDETICSDNLGNCLAYNGNKYVSFSLDNRAFTPVYYQLSNLWSYGQDEDLKRLLLKNPILFAHIFESVCHKSNKKELARWIIDNQEKWDVRQGYKGNNVKEVLYCCILSHSFFPEDHSAYIDDIKKLIPDLSHNILYRGFSTVCSSIDNQTFDLLYPLMKPTYIELSRAIYSSNVYKFNKLLDHPQCVLDNCSSLVYQIIKMYVCKKQFTRENIEKILDKIPVNEHLIFDRETITYINQHEELNWIKEHPKWSTKAFEKRSAKDFIKVAIEKTYDDDIKRILSIATDLIDEPDKEFDFSDSEWEIEELIWKYN
jgi:hypothetical protein